MVFLVQSSCHLSRWDRSVWITHSRLGTFKRTASRDVSFYIFLLGLRFCSYCQYFQQQNTMIGNINQVHDIHLAKTNKKISRQTRDLWLKWNMLYTANAMYPKFETNIPRHETARPRSQFQHSCLFCERLIYSNDWSANAIQQNRRTYCGNI